MAFPGGVNPVYPHRFSASQMNSLEAILDALIPSIPCGDENDDGIKDHDKISFYGLSASQAGIVSPTAGLLCNKLKWDKVEVLKLLLWLLSTRLGTMMVFGSSLSSSRRTTKNSKSPLFFLGFFPRRSFSEMEVEDREMLLLHGWSLSSSVFFRTVFTAIKSFATFSYFTKVDETGWNPTWKAIGYCGPDPAAAEHRRKHPAPATKPLDGAVIDADLLKPDELVAKLAEAGFAVLDQPDLGRLQAASGADPGQKTAAAEKKTKKKVVGVRCDAVVVGSGCGGGVVAAVLAEAGYRVLVVEKGKYYARDDLSLLEGESMDKMYEGGGLLPTDDANLLLLAGSTVGGGTAVNWSASFRTPAEVRREWSEELGLSLFGSEEYDAAMDAVFRRLSVQRVEVENLQNAALRRGCEGLGYHAEGVERNCGGAEHRCGWCGFGCWSGTKQATSETWLVDAAGTGRAAIVTGFEAKSVLLRRGKKKAVGVRGGTAMADVWIESRVTVVCCGALSTPVLLQRSGLRNPHIGKHLHLHPVQMMWGYFPAAAETGTSYDGGIITVVSKQFVTTPQRSRKTSGCILQCPSAHPGVFSVLMPWLSGKDYKQRMERYARTLHVFALARDRGEGSVEWRGGQRRILYELEEADEAGLVEAGEGALKVLLAAGAEEVGTHGRHGDKLVLLVKNKKQEEEEQLVAEFLETVRRRRLSELGVTLCSAHQMSSCRMGTAEEDSVVGQDGRVWEADGLYVADGSVLPTAIGVNPMITIQSVAMCIARALLRHLSSSSSSSSVA